jgi:hypothetical protein
MKLLLERFAGHVTIASLSDSQLAMHMSRLQGPVTSDAMVKKMTKRSPVIQILSSGSGAEL